MSDGDHTILLKASLAGVIAALVAALLGTTGGLDPGVRDAILLTTLAVSAGGLASVVLLGDRRRRRARIEALSDPLTGLGSARSLHSDLAEALRDGRQTTLLIFDLEGFKKYNDSYGHACGDALLWRLGHKLAGAIAPHHAYRLRGDEYGALVPGEESYTAEVRRRAVSSLFEVGEGFMIRCSHGGVSLPSEARSVSEALKVADQRVHAERNESRFSGGVERGEETTAMLPAAPRLPPPRFDVAELSGRVARRLDLEPALLAELEVAAQLRDVGNMAIPDEILHSEGDVGAEGWRFIRFHTLVGERLLGAGFGMHEVARLVRSSHERWDGRGYPDGLAGAEIPLGSRILFVCSAFEDMTSKRAHRAALSAQRALEELRRCASTQFDPAVVRVFGEIIELPEISAPAPRPSTPA